MQHVHNVREDAYYQCYLSLRRIILFFIMKDKGTVNKSGISDLEQAGGDWWLLKTLLGSKGVR
jgi:hypothetical protein